MNNILIEDQFGHGAIDKPEDFLKPTSYKHEEIAAGFQPAVWKEKNMNGGFVTYPKRNQEKQSSCVLYVLAKQLGVDELQENGVWRDLSPRSLYPYLVVLGGGASSIASHKLACKQGMTLEALLQTDGLGETDVRTDTGYVTDAKQVALIYRPQSYIECGSDFETIASILYNYQQKGIKKVISVTVIGVNNGTWLTATPTPPTNPNSPTIWYHRISVTDFGLINGKKYLAFDNSMGITVGIAGQQFLSIEYEPFIYGAIYTLNLKDDWQQGSPTPPSPPPTYTWTVDLSVGSTGPDVLALQIALQSMGFFPVSSAVVSPNGIFGGITKASVIKFQQSFGITPTGNAGPVTRAKLNEIF